MGLTIEIPPELHARLREEASKRGVDDATFVANALEERLREPPALLQQLPKVEADLLREINREISPESWERYHALIVKREAEALSPEEQTALVDLSDQIEEANARCMGHLVELARLRAISVESLMRDLGIRPFDHG